MAAETALVDIIKQKPPPKIDGWMHLATDQRMHFTDDERRSAFQSDEGQLFARAMTRCQGHEHAIREARSEWLKHRDNKTKRLRLEQERNKYVECLTFVACPNSWHQYSQCWSSLHNLNVEQMQQLRSLGPEVACQYERQSLERCVGAVVAGVLRAAVSSSEEEPVCDWP